MHTDFISNDGRKKDFTEIETFSVLRRGDALGTPVYVLTIRLDEESEDIVDREGETMDVETIDAHGHTVFQGTSDIRSCNILKNGAVDIVVSPSTEDFLVSDGIVRHGYIA